MRATSNGQLTRNGKLRQSTRREPKLDPPLAEVGIVLMDLSLRPLAFDRGAAEMFPDAARCGGSTGPALSIPREIIDIIRRSRPGDPLAEKVRFSLGAHDYSCRAYLLESPNHFLQGAILAVHLEREAPAYDAVSHVGWEYDLTGREQEVLKGIAIGLTSKEVAERMKISPNTVKTFLRTIMMKLGVSTRSGVVAKLLEHSDAR